MATKTGLALAGVGALALGTAAYGALVEKNRFVLRHEQVPILDAGSAPIRVLHLSDIHMAPWHTDAISWIRALADLKPDLIVGTGDFLGHREGLSALTEALLPFAGIPGVVTHGSNDRIAPRFVNPVSYLFQPSDVPHQGDPLDFEGLLNLYTNVLGWHDIDNGTTRLTINSSTLDIVGIGDAHDNLDHTSEMSELLDTVRENSVDAPDADRSSVVTMGVTHAPYRRVLDAFVTNACEIIFAGHTHGGQVCLPNGKALTTNCDLPTEQAGGLSVWRHAHRSSFLHVSRGLGTSVWAPVRLFCPPEATLVTLVGDDIGYA
jgi:predicted MPP superfamily phosphohydrolase